MKNKYIDSILRFICALITFPIVIAVAGAIGVIALTFLLVTSMIGFALWLVFFFPITAFSAMFDYACRKKSQALHDMWESFCLCVDYTNGWFDMKCHCKHILAELINETLNEMKREEEHANAK